MKMEDKSSFSAFTPCQIDLNAQTNETVFIESCEPTNKTDIPIKEESPPSPVTTTSKTEKVRLECSECSRVCYSADSMVAHMRKHRGQNPFQCSLCDHSTYNKTLFTEHVNGHLGVKPYQCSKCNYSTSYKKYLKVHEQRHETCDHCGFVAKSTKKLLIHQKEKGCQIEKKNPYKCTSCNISFATNADLVSHCNRHSMCALCGIQLSKKKLTKHMEKEHGMEVKLKKKFECKHCEYKASGHAKILWHLIHHPQNVDPSIDVTPLVKCGILPGNND